MDKKKLLMPHILSAAHLYVSYAETPVLHDVSLAVHSGEVVCLTGPNGSGKSTLLSLLAGIVPQDLKIISAEQLPAFDGKAVSACSRKQSAQHIAYLLQDEQSAWNYTVRSIVLTGRYAHTVNGIYTAMDRAASEDAMAAAGISGLADRFIFSLSGGESQKVRIARALAQQTDMILFDEPVANLDFGYQTELLAFIVQLAHSAGKGVLVSIHDLNTAARFADRMILLPKNSPCIEGTPRDVLVPDILQNVYGTPFGVFEHPVYHCPQVYIILPQSSLHTV